MLTSLAIIFLLGLFLGKISKQLNLPSLIGMILTGMILGPYVLGLLDNSILQISADLRKMALVIILTRAGLSLNIGDLKKVGRLAILMCFVPSCFEIAGVLLIAPRILHITLLEAAIMGAVIAAVSPAVVVPRMIKLIEEGYGTDKSIPQLILAGASVDNILVIILFSAFTSLESNDKFSLRSFTDIPLSIFFGIIIGFLMGILLIQFFKKFHMRDSVKILILLSISFLLLELQNRLNGIIPISGLLSIMSFGIIIKQKYSRLATRLSAKYNKLWVAAEVLLFVLVGAMVDISYAIRAGATTLIVVLGALLIRMLGVFVCLLKSKLTIKERIFCTLAYTPKATVQAAIGGVPLAMGLACGQKVLTVAVLAILITAPFGAICIDNSYQKLLKKECALGTFSTPSRVTK